MGQQRAGGALAMVHANGAGATIPAPLTPMLGRDQELARVLDLIRRPQVRLATLTGPGGVGKTRLALAIAHAAGAHFPGGVRFVPLATLRDPGLLLPAIAQAAGVRLGGERPVVAQIADALGTDPNLLILDNVEQLLAAAPEVAALLSVTPGLTILATSREALRVRGDHEVPVPPLAVPDQAVIGVATASGSAAVELYAARARAVRPGFVLTDENARAVAEICRRLDGLPLAIELAAARSKVLTPAALLARLTNRLQVLTGGLSDLPDRQRTMRAAIAWSHDLLAPDEQALFRRLAVFSGGFSLEAAETVRGGQESGDSRLLTPTLEGLESLVDKSLLVRRDVNGGDEPRVLMLETVREFGWEQLVAWGEAGAIRDRHAAYFVDLAERIAPRLFGEDRLVWLERLDAEHANMRAALVFAIERGDVATGLRHLAGLWRYWEQRGHLTEGRTWADRVFALPGRVDSAVHAHALYGAAFLTYRQDDYERAAALCEESLAMARRLDDRAGIAFALNGLGNIAFGRGDHRRALAHYEESLALRRALNDANEILTSLNNVGILLYQIGEYDRAERHLLEALEVARTAEDHQGVPYALNGLGMVAHGQGRLDLAAARLEEAVALRRGRETGSLAASLTNLAAVVYDQGDVGRAADLYREALALRWANGEQRGVADALGGLVGLAAATGQANLAVRIFGAVEALRERIGAPVWPIERAEHDESLGVARAALGDVRFAAALAAGRASPLAEAVAAANAVAEGGRREAEEDDASASRLPPSALPFGLTPREMEVLRLVTEGLSDREVAAALSISPATAARHVANIFVKLEVRTRTAAATLAIRHGLV